MNKIIEIASNLVKAGYNWIELAEIATHAQEMEAEIAQLEANLSAAKTAINYWRRPVPQVSATTQRLIDLLIERDQAGLAKYGTTLDRTDLSHTEWLQHMTEEALDAAGYAQAAIRTYQEQGK